MAGGKLKRNINNQCDDLWVRKSPVDTGEIFKTLNPYEIRIY